MAQRRKSFLIETIKALTALAFVILAAGSAGVGILAYALSEAPPLAALALAAGGPLACIVIFGPIFVMFDNNDLSHELADQAARRNGP